MKYILIVVALVCATLQTTRADDRSRRHKIDPEQAKELREWFKNEVYPTLKKMHDEYDASLSAEDLTKLTALRNQAKQVKEKILLEMKSVKDQDLDKEEARKRLHQIREQSHDDMYDLAEQVRPIIERSKEKLKAIFDAHEDDIEAWKEKVEDMRGKGSDPTMDMFRGNPRRIVLRFVLWDGSLPSNPPPTFGQEGLTSGVDRLTSTSAPLSVFPNPSGTSARISLDNVEQSTVKIDVFDMNGTLVSSHTATTQNGRLDATIPTTGLAEGNYMVSVNTPTGRRSSSLAVTR